MFALTTGVVAVIMALVKIYLGYKLESEAMATDSELVRLSAHVSVDLFVCVSMTASVLGIFLRLQARD